MDSMALLTAMSLGAMGSVHCLAMCGGIACLASAPRRPGISGGGLIATTGTPQGDGLLAERFVPLLAYNGGRIFSYATAGLFIGLLTQYFLSVAQEMQLVLRTLAGTVLVIVGLTISGLSRGSAALERAGFALWQRLSQLPLPSLTSRASPLAMGVAWGWLPCGLVYSSLLWAGAHSASAGESALLMFAFGLGTLPAMLCTGVMAARLQQLLASTPLRVTAGAGILLYGLWTVAGAFIMASHHGEHDHHQHLHHGSIGGFECQLVEPDQSQRATPALHYRHRRTCWAPPTEVLA